MKRVKMQAKQHVTTDKEILNKTPIIENINKLGIVSHDYRFKEENNYRDFSYSLKNVLSYLDNKYCDSVLFSLFTIVPREDFEIKEILNKLKNIKVVFIEEYIDGVTRDNQDYVIYFKEASKWNEYRTTQRFGTLKYTKKFINTIIEPFKKDIKRERLFGNFLILLCGETNIVKYSRASKEIKDELEFVDILPKQTEVILNPIHDRMTRFEMKLKRKFLSKKNRWVISVWNKGKVYKDGKTRDGKKPAWTAYKNGVETQVERIKHCIPNQTHIEIGILEMSNDL